MGLSFTHFSATLFKVRAPIDVVVVRTLSEDNPDVASSASASERSSAKDFTVKYLIHEYQHTSKHIQTHSKQIQIDHPNKDSNKTIQSIRNISPSPSSNRKKMETLPKHIKRTTSPHECLAEQTPSLENFEEPKAFVVVGECPPLAPPTSHECSPRPRWNPWYQCLGFAK